MKTPKANKLPSGSWYVRVKVHGKQIAITKPTKREAEAEALRIKLGDKKAPSKERVTLSEAIDRYIEARETVCSPSTIRGYRVIQDTRFKSMMGTDIFTVTHEQWQQAVNNEAKLVSAKTVKNSWGFISSVIHEVTGERYSVTLPQVIDKTIPFLTSEQIPVFVAAIHGTSVEIPALLGLSSLRQSEILALRWSDVDLKAGTLSINGATVRNYEGDLVRKQETKNRSSRRTVPIFPPLMDALKAADRDGEMVVNLAPNSIRNHINRICKANDLPRIGIHGLRHSFASLAQHLGIPEKVVMELGGWSDYQTMKRIYTHVSKQDIVSRSSQISDFFSENCKTDSSAADKNCNEIVMKKP